MRPRSLARRLLGGREQPPPARKRDGLRDARDALARLAAEDDPVVAGPWLAEVGYELLYWIPFLRWALEVEPGLAGRLTVVSRGGVASWYDGIAERYVELFDHYAPEELERARERASAETGGVRKQMAETAADGEILARLSGELPPGSAILHPSLLFQAFRQTLKRPSLRLDELPYRFAPLVPPAVELELPASFVAVRFYHRASFPDTPENRALVARTLDSLAAQGQVVSLDPGRRYDDHVDAGAPDGVLRLDELGEPATNLAVQSAVAARATSFVGTYGGLAYLGPLLGVPSLSFYSDASRFRRQHLDLARLVFADSGYGRFVALDTADLPVLERLLPSGPG
jgi:hypothetical protein